MHDGQKLTQNNPAPVVPCFSALPSHPICSIVVAAVHLRHPDSCQTSHVYRIMSYRMPHARTKAGRAWRNARRVSGQKCQPIPRSSRLCASSAPSREAAVAVAVAAAVGIHPAETGTFGARTTIQQPGHGSSRGSSSSERPYCRRVRRPPSPCAAR